MYHLQRQQQLNCSLEEAWDFFSNPRNLDQLTPESVGFKITHCKSESMHLGQMIGYKVKIAPFIWVKWLTEITLIKDNGTEKQFIDDQRIGPYSVWHHTHTFEENEDGVLMTDDVIYDLPLGPIGQIVHALYVKSQLKHIFDERQRLTTEIFKPKA